jgi:hypothetical protein
MMLILRTRVNQEWQDLSITYPHWLAHIVMDDIYYVVTLVAMSLVCFAVGLILGIVWTVV